MADFQITVLGSRGSAPIEGDLYSVYGGATSCIYVRAADQTILLDAGSGLMMLPEFIGDCKHISLILSHPHIDHIIGLLSCPVMFNPNIKIDIYSKLHEGLSAREQIDCVMTLPIWPINTHSFLADINYITCDDEFFIGDVRVRCESGNHPGSCTIYRLDYLDKSLVYATDHELTEQNFSYLEEFAKDCTLLLGDGQYTSSEIKSRTGYGHSSWEDMARLGMSCGAKKLGIIHHSPFRTDEDLDKMQLKMQTIFPGGFFTRIKGEISL